MSTIYWSAGRSGPLVAPGTYRTGDGRLVHCRRRSTDEIVCEIEGAGIPRAAIPTLAIGLVRLSDDPDWPDWDVAPRQELLVD